MKAIICDDKTEESEYYAAKLQQIAEKSNISLELVIYNSATSLLFDAADSKFCADVIYMDIHMPNMTGDVAAKELRNMGYVNDIIFLTCSQKYFLTAFDVDALHYVVKRQTSAEDFERIFLKAVSSLQDRKQKYVAYYGGGETRNIPLNSILYYEIYRGIVTVHYDGNKEFEFPQDSLLTLENQLEQYGFFRSHKSFLVALAAIESVTYNEIQLYDGTKLPLGRKKYAELKNLLVTNLERGNVL